MRRMRLLTLALLLSVAVGQNSSETKVIVTKLSVLGVRPKVGPMQS